MFKNTIFLVIALILIFLVVLAQLKSTEAEKSMLQAMQKIEAAETKAEEQEKRAVMAAADAIIAQRKAEDTKLELEKCKSGK